MRSAATGHRLRLVSDQFLRYAGGSLGMILVSGSTAHIVATISAMQVGVGFLGFLCWRLIKNNRRIVQTKDHEAL